MKEQSGYLSRQKNFILIIFILTSLPGRIFGQDFPFSAGARSWGMANATVAVSDFSSVFNNIAGLGGVREGVMVSTYDSHYGFEGINTIGFGGVLPVSNDLGAGFTVQRFGDRLYNQFAFGMGAGHRVGRFSLGGKVSYLQNAVNAPSLTISRHTFAVEFGGIVQFSSKFTFGAHVFNLTQSSYSGSYGSRLPTVLRGGFVYKPQKNLAFHAEIDKNTDLPVSVKGGLEYQALKKMYIRTGLASRPLTNHFGAGFKGGKFSVDYAVHLHVQLGWSHHFSLGYCFWERKKDELGF